MGEGTWQKQAFLSWNLHLVSFFPTLHFINFVLLQLEGGGGGCECKSQLFREACVFYFPLREKKKKESELPLGSRLQEPQPLGLKRTPAAAPLSNEQVASDIVGEQRSRGTLQYFCCVYPLLRIQPPDSHLPGNISREGTHTLKWASRPVWVSENEKARQGIKNKNKKPQVTLKYNNDLWGKSNQIQTTIK